MKTLMRLDESRLTKLLESHELTAGMYVRVHGDHLIMGRRESFGPTGALEDDDRLRLTRLNGSSYGLSVKRHTGRWERTPFAGTMDDMVATIRGCLQHFVVPWTKTSGARH